MTDSGANTSHTAGPDGHRRGTYTVSEFCTVASTVNTLSTNSVLRGGRQRTRRTHTRTQAAPMYPRTLGGRLWLDSQRRSRGFKSHHLHTVCAAQRAPRCPLVASAGVLGRGWAASFGHSIQIGPLVVRPEEEHCDRCRDDLRECRHSPPCRPAQTGSKLAGLTRR